MHQRSTGTKRYHHPLVGDLTVSYQALSPGDDPDQTLMVYDTEPSSASAHALQLLAAGNARISVRPLGQDSGTGSTAPPA